MQINEATSACCKCLALVKPCSLDKLDTSMKHRRISQRQKDVVNELRQICNAFVDWHRSSHEAFEEKQVREAALHVGHLDQLTSIPESRHFIENELSQLLAVFTASWTQDLKALQASIAAICPKWEAFKKAILTQRLLVNEFKDMKPLHFNNLGPLCNALRDNLALVKAVAGSPMVEFAHQKASKDIITMGRKTIIYRVVICCLEVEWPKLHAPAEVNDAVQKLRETCNAKKVQLTEQMEEAIELWSCGKKLEELYAASLADGLQKAVQPVPEKAEQKTEKAEQKTEQDAKQAEQKPDQDKQDMEVDKEEPPQAAPMTLQQKLMAAKRRRFS